MGGISIKDLNYSYNNLNVFSSLNYSLNANRTLSIIGPSGTGKTTLLKLLNGDLEYNGKISILGVAVNKDNYKKLREKIAVVFDVENFVNELVKDEIRYSLENINMNPKDIMERINELDTFFGIKKIMNKPIELLSLNDRALVKILSYAIYCPKYLALDDLLCYLDQRSRILLLNYLNYKKIILINVTSNLEDVLFTDNTICLYNHIIAIEGKSLEVLKEEKILKRMGLSLPFYVDISIQLKLYGLIKKTILNKEDLVKALWK